MINTKNAFTYAANVFILTLGLIMFATKAEDGTSLREQSLHDFRIVTFIGLAIGLCTTMFYIVAIREVPLTEAAVECQIKYNSTTLTSEKSTTSTSSGTSTSGKDWRAWLGEGTFYIHGVVYVLVRMATNVNMAIQPFYLQLVTGYGIHQDIILNPNGCIDKANTPPSDPTPPELALVPLISYVMSLLFSLFLQQRMTRCLRNRFLPLLVAILIIICTSLPLLFVTEDPSVRWVVFPLVGF